MFVHNFFTNVSVLSNRLEELIEVYRYYYKIGFAEFDNVYYYIHIL